MSEGRSDTAIGSPAFEAAKEAAQSRGWVMEPSVISAMLAAAFGPLLERLDQAENDVNEWKDWEARARGRADDLQQRLDQAERERDEAGIKWGEHYNTELANLKHRLALASNAVACLSTDRDDARRTIQRFRDRSEQAESDLAAAQARAEAAEAKIERVRQIAENDRLGLSPYGVDRDQIFAVLAGDAARPQPKGGEVRLKGCPYPVCSCVTGAQPLCSAADRRIHDPGDPLCSEHDCQCGEEGHCDTCAAVPEGCEYPDDAARPLPEPEQP